MRIATYLAPALRPVYHAIASAIGDRLSCPTELLVGASFAQFTTGEVDVGFLCGLPYVQLMRQPAPPVELLAAPVLQGARYGGRPVSFSDVIVARDSSVQTFADLRGRAWAFNEPDSHSCYNLTRFQLVRLGETRGYFGRVVAAGWHQRAIRLVAAQEVDAAAIDSQVLAIELREHPGLARQVRVFAVWGPSPIQPVVAARLPAERKAPVRAALLALGDDPAVKRLLAWGGVDRFMPVTDADGDPIRAMLAAAEAADFRTLR